MKLQAGMVKDKYRLKETPRSITIQPGHYLLKRDVKWYVAGIVFAALCLPLVQRQWGENGFITGIIIIVVIASYLVHDFFFRINVRYIFDSGTQSVYRTNRPFVNHKCIMRFDEVTIFTRSETGEWYYAMGIKKKQFLKNYRLSESFGAGKKSEQRQYEYENEILARIESIIARKKGL
ncbi:MAG: hypothetical protein KF862_07735 [Chitinophagaceae bacterium]|nr:hypothetical protein [Chitinophagaceae bacterium]